MQEKEKQLHKVYQVGDHSFPVYREYDEQLDKSYPAFPDFEIPGVHCRRPTLCYGGAESLPLCHGKRSGGRNAG